MLTNRLRRHGFLVIIFLILWGVLLSHVDAPMYGHHESGITWMSASIRVFNEYGFASTNFIPVRTPGPTTPDDGFYYLTHPPTIVWIITLGTRLFGYSAETLAPYESSVRMIGILFTMVSVAIFYALTRRLTTPRISLVAFAFYALAPVTMYYGTLPYYDMLNMPLILGFAYVYSYWMEKFTTRRMVTLMLIGSCAMWFDWPAVFYLTSFGIIALIFGNREQRIGIVSIGFVVGLATVILMGYMVTAHPDAITSIQEKLVERTSNEMFFSDGETFTLTQFAIQLMMHMFLMVSISSTVLGLIGVGVLLREKKTVKNLVILGLLAAPTLFLILVRSAFHFHDWYKLHYLPGFALAAAIVAVRGWQIEPTGLKTYIRPFIFALVVVTLVVNFGYVTYLHLKRDNPYMMSLAIELPQYTEQDDYIATSYNIYWNSVNYYAYRNITWGVRPEEAARFYEESDSIDLHYLLCLEPDTVDSYDGVFSQYDYVVLAGQCRLIHLVK